MTHTHRAILITGTSSGIGSEAARQLKARGWRVLATARKPEDRARIERDLGVETIALELSDMASIARAAEEALERTNGQLFALYNNAAYGVIGAMEDISADLLRHHFDVNVIGTHELTRRLIPAMRKQGQGRIVSCSSVLGLVSGPYRGPYCATKFAIEAIHDALRLELAGTNIHVSVLQPGPIKTAFLGSTLSTFKASVDVANSPHRAQYEKRMAAMENETSSRFKLGPDAVVAKLIHALESPRPKARYKISPHTHIISLARRILPMPLVDALMARS
jgi:NAD(P)-dependent dehydrogenase (short-subunit alcohol dehydrogenase family)